MHNLEKREKKCITLPTYIHTYMLKKVAKKIWVASAIFRKNTESKQSPTG
jgi:hypothetical protein